jgi:hypothetical protein
VSWMRVGSVMSRAALCCLGLLLGPSGCTGSETGNPTATKLTLSLRSSDPTVASVGDSGDGIRVSELWLSVEDIRMVGCGTTADEVLLNPKPFVANLADGFSVSGPPAGQYCAVRLGLVPKPLAQLPSGVPAGDASSAVYGARADSVPFAILSAASLDLSIPGDAFTVGDGDSLLLAFDVAGWLRSGVLDEATVSGGTALLDGRVHPAVTATFEAQLTVSLHRDANQDGRVDPDETALAGLH